MARPQVTYPPAETFLRKLNAAQREAVSTTSGPLLVLAGAGTGKTRVITHRIAYLLARGADPERILAVTFTNKAAREMRERIADLLGRRPRGLTLSTFHSLGVRILRREAPVLGYRTTFGICDEGDQAGLVRTALRDLKGSLATIEPRAILAAISRAKSRFELPDDCLEAAADDYEHLVARVYARYQEALRGLSCVDFDDLILLPVLAMRKDPEVAARYQLRYRHVLVDEYQDTNGAQYRFLQHLVGPERNLCVVGDDDQSIYAFRGAESDKILGFGRDFPGARVVKLEENYRSTGAILGLANAVIQGNPGRYPKVLRSTLGAGEAVRLVMAPNEQGEVDHVIREIADAIEQDRAPAAWFAILFRAAAQARPFEEKLRLRRIPYTLVGGQSYFDRKEVKDVLAYLRAASNPSDDLSLLRIINVPRRGVGNATIEKLDRLAGERGCGLQEAMRLGAAGEGGVPAATREALRGLHELLEVARARLGGGDLLAVARHVVEASGYRGAIDELYPDPQTAEGRWKAVTDLLAALESWEKENPGKPLSEFLDALALRDEPGKDDDGARRGVMLMTLHGAKGLEFPRVYLVGVEEDLLPHRRSIEDGERGIEEERRLFYVGITRARERLTILTAATRHLHGKERPRIPSRFLREVQGTGALASSPYSGSLEPTAGELEGLLARYRGQKAPRS